MKRLAASNKMLEWVLDHLKVESESIFSPEVPAVMYLRNGDPGYPGEAQECRMELQGSVPLADLKAAFPALTEDDVEALCSDFDESNELVKDFLYESFYELKQSPLDGVESVESCDLRVDGDRLLFAAELEASAEDTTEEPDYNY